jgi:hypothetical protein
MGRLRDRFAILDEDLVNAVKIGAIDVARSRRSVSEWLTGARGGLNRLVAGRIRAVGGHPCFFDPALIDFRPTPGSLMILRSIAFLRYWRSFGCVWL